MMAVTWDQLGNMSANQITKAKNFENIGKQLQIPSDAPDISAVTVGQAKTAQDFLNFSRALIETTLRGANYVRQKNAGDAAKTADDQFPPE
jgi:hypothetical protein